MQNTTISKITVAAAEAADNNRQLLSKQSCQKWRYEGAKKTGKKKAIGAILSWID